VTFTLTGVFFAYLTVFLAVIFAAWLFFGWQRRRSELSSRPVHACTCSGARFTSRSDAVAPPLRQRCPKCGVVQPTSNPLDGKLV